VQADAEHQQDDADLGQFLGQVAVGDVARRERADSDAGKEIAHQGRGLEPRGDGAENERQHDAADNGGDQGRFMRHGSGPAPCRIVVMGGPSARTAYDQLRT